MRKLILVASTILLTINVNSQCIEDNFNLTKGYNITSTEYGDFGKDIKKPVVTYQEYSDKKGNVITINYAESFEFSDEDGLVHFEDEKLIVELPFSSSSTSVITCKHTEKKIYTKTYIMEQEFYIEPVSMDKEPVEVLITSNDSDFSTILRVSIKHNIGYAHSVLVYLDDKGKKRFKN